MKRVDSGKEMDLALEYAELSLRYGHSAEWVEDHLYKYFHITPEAAHRIIRRFWYGYASDEDTQ